MQNKISALLLVVSLTGCASAVGWGQKYEACTRTARASRLNMILSSPT